MEDRLNSTYTVCHCLPEILNRDPDVDSFTAAYTEYFPLFEQHLSDINICTNTLLVWVFLWDLLKFENIKNTTMTVLICKSKNFKDVIGKKMK